MLTTDPKKHWERLARVDPYFAVLTSDRYRALRDAGARAEFFSSGEADVARLFAALPADRRPRVAVDFGCGVGRLTLALARRAESVVAVDASPTMLELTRENAAAAGLTNVQAMRAGEFFASGLRADLIVSLLVFQHVPRREGMKHLRRLCESLEPDGTIAVHVPYWRSGSTIARLLRWARSRVPGVNIVANVLARRPATAPYMQMNVYRLEEVLRSLHESGIQDVRLLDASETDVHGVIFVGTRPGS